MRRAISKRRWRDSRPNRNLRSRNDDRARYPLVRQQLNHTPDRGRYRDGSRRLCCLSRSTRRIPDLSDTQVILYTDYSGQAPQVVEDQVTYPLSTAMLSVPRSKVVRGFSFFGVSFVYVIFEEGTDIYWARSRVLEYLSAAARNLPQGVTPSLGPDATGVGWVYQYVVRGAQRSLAELRAIQDWHLRFGLSNAS